MGLLSLILGACAADPEIGGIVPSAAYTCIDDVGIVLDCIGVAPARAAILHCTAAAAAQRPRAAIALFGAVEEAFPSGHVALSYNADQDVRDSGASLLQVAFFAAYTLAVVGLTYIAIAPDKANLAKVDKSLA